MADRNARVWNGSAWELISAPVSAANAVATWQATAPSSPITGQIWIDSDDNSMYVWGGSSWVSVSLDLSLYATKDGPIFTGSVVLPSSTSIGTVSSTEIGYLDGVTSSVQTQIDGKQKTIPLQSSAPLSPSTGDFWADSTTPETPLLKVYDGADWVLVAGGGGGADSDQIIISTRMFT